ncbi:MAG: apolipoprotein N-acyltransferase [Candidatus Omnitrophota bacterium]|nr:apolipoprotein N-acyltransferase [Candidatus Omnitrophota bacterium]
MKKGIFQAIVSGALLALAFSSFNLGFLAWFGFVPVFLALKDTSLRKAFFLFLITGIVFWAGTIYWLVHVTLIGTIVLVVYLASYFAIFGLIIRPCTRQSKLWALIFIPSAWVLLEYLRTVFPILGFSWALLGYSQYLYLPFIQIADITGTWGVSFLLMFANVAIVELIYALRTKQARRLAQASVLLVLFLVLVLSYGFYRINERRTTPRLRSGQADDPSTSLGAGGRRIKVSVIQGNIPQEYKWVPDYNEFIMNRYITLTAAAAADKPDLVIWPEAAFPVVLEEEPGYLQRVKDMAAAIRAPILIGTITTKDGLYFNSAVLVQPQGELSRYNKIHRVPFGEYIPLKDVLPFLETIVPIGDIAKGNEYSVFTIHPAGSSEPLNFSALICFEDVFAGLSRNFTRNGADFLVNITNDAWYKYTSAPFQHLQASVLRAVENRLNLARSANTGISCFIDPTGKIISVVKDDSDREIFVQGYKTQEISVTRAGPSFYCRFGDWFILICALIALFFLVRPLVVLRHPAAPYVPPRR